MPAKRKKNDSIQNWFDQSNSKLEFHINIYVS